MGAQARQPTQTPEEPYILMQSDLVRSEAVHGATSWARRIVTLADITARDPNISGGGQQCERHWLVDSLSCGARLPFKIIPGLSFLPYN